MDTSDPAQARVMPVHTRHWPGPFSSFVVTGHQGWQAGASTKEGSRALDPLLWGRGRIGDSDIGGDAQRAGRLAAAYRACCSWLLVNRTARHLGDFCQVTRGHLERITCPSDAARST